MYEKHKAAKTAGWKSDSRGQRGRDLEKQIVEGLVCVFMHFDIYSK